jgi:RNA polymerase sigma-70 factor (ECF subfamily)
VPDDLTLLEDRELMRRHVAGDGGAAFGELFRRHRDRMYAVAVRTTNHRELAADAVQEAFISAFRRAEAYRGDAAVTTWLHRIVVNACLDRLRREKTSVRRAGDLGELDLPDLHDHHASVEARLDVREALARLPEGQRMALVLVDMHGLPVAEAAAVLGVAEGTVKSRCSRGREALAAILRPARAPGAGDPADGAEDAVGGDPVGGGGEPRRSP